MARGGLRSRRGAPRARLLYFLRHRVAFRSVRAEAEDPRSRLSRTVDAADLFGLIERGEAVFRSRAGIAGGGTGSGGRGRRRNVGVRAKESARDTHPPSRPEAGFVRRAAVVRLRPCAGAQGQTPKGFNTGRGREPGARTHWTCRLLLFPDCCWATDFTWWSEEMRSAFRPTLRCYLEDQGLRRSFEWQGPASSAASDSGQAVGFVLLGVSLGQGEDVTAVALQGQAAVACQIITGSHVFRHVFCIRPAKLSTPSGMLHLGLLRRGRRSILFGFANPGFSRGCSRDFHRHPQQLREKVHRRQVPACPEMRYLFLFLGEWGVDPAASSLIDLDRRVFFFWRGKMPGVRAKKKLRRVDRGHGKAGARREKLSSASTGILFSVSSRFRAGISRFRDPRAARAHEKMASSCSWGARRQRGCARPEAPTSRFQIARA